MDIDLAEIEQSLGLVYQKNLNFLKENFFDIFKKLEQFSVNLEENKIQEKYSLELKDGYFDILNLENNGYYYAINSYMDAEARASNTDFTDNSSLDLLRKIRGSKKLSIPSGLSEVLPVVDFINKKVDLENIEFQKIMKFAHIGVGLGIHIQEIEKKIESYTTLIIEPELEIFRLSLFTLDYTVFEEGGRKLFLNVGDDISEREKVFSAFFNYHSYMNYNIKHYTLLKGLSYIKTHLVEFCEHNYAGSFPYKLVIENVQRTVRFIRDEDRFLVTNKLLQKKPFANKEVLLISAGPSLDNYIELIKKYQAKFIITCVDVSVRKLEKNEIVPDIVFSIDPQQRHAGFLTTKDPEFLKNSAIILLSQQHPDVMKLLRKRKLNYYMSQFDNVNKEIGSLGSVPNVGTFSFHVMAHLGAKKMYTIGNDAAFDQTTGDRYSSDSYSKIDIIDINTKNTSSISKTDILEVKGNLREKVKTNRDLNSFKLHYDQIINHIRGYIKYEAYNLSDGVYIDGIEPMDKDKFIEVAEKIIPLNKDVVNICNSISKVLEADCYENDIKIINSIIQKTKKFQKQKISSRDDFLTKKLDLMIWILEKSKEQSIGLFGNIFLHYTDLVDSYINFAINLKQKDLYTQKNLELLRDHWAKGVVAVFKGMKEALLDEVSSIDVYVENKKIDKITRYIFNSENGRIFDAGRRKILYDVPDIYQKKINQVIFKDATNGNLVSNIFVDVIMRNDKEYPELSFKRSLDETVNKEKIKDLDSEDAIGFLAIEENLNDNKFINYIKKLQKEYPHVIFKAFVFNKNNNDKIIHLFKNSLQIILVDSIMELMHHSKIFISNTFVFKPSSNLELKISNFMFRHASNNLALRTSLDIENLSARKWSKQQMVNHNKYIKYLKDKNIIVSDISDNFYEIIFDSLIVKTGLDKNFKFSLDDSTLYAMLEIPLKYALESDDFFKSYIKVVSAMNQFNINEN